ncbi:MAG: CobW family GTP-binding protein [Burkholderiaceae bacterium]
MGAPAAVAEAVLVTGFLGAGKTTFIRDVLARQLAGGGRRFAVLVNDFGDTGFDGPLLQRAGLPVIEVEGGCVCCVAGGRLLDALHRIRSEIAPELLIVEGSGLADPWPLLEALHAVGFLVLGAPCLVDAVAHARLRNDPLYLRQIDAATLLLVSKAALAGSDATSAVERFLAERRSAAAVRVLGRDDAGLLPLLSGEALARRALPPDVRSDAERAWTWRPTGFPSLAALLESLQQEDGIYRVKGVCQFEESATPIALNWAFGHASTMPVATNDSSALTFLGPGATPALAARLPACAPWSAGEFEREGPLPAGAFDARPGAGFAWGRAVDELHAAEALVAFCDPGAGSLGLVIDAGLSDLLTDIGGQVLPVVLTDHRYATLRSAAARLARAGAARVVIMTRAASAEVIATLFGTQRTATVTPMYCLQAPAVALRGLDHRRAASVLRLLGTGHTRRAEHTAPYTTGGFASRPHATNL